MCLEQLTAFGSFISAIATTLAVVVALLLGFIPIRRQKKEREKKALYLKHRLMPITTRTRVRFEQSLKKLKANEVYVITEQDRALFRELESISPQFDLLDEKLFALVIDYYSTASLLLPSGGSDQRLIEDLKRRVHLVNDELKRQGIEIRPIQIKPPPVE
ncbi:MAG: hypothetical protein JW701_08545 [Kosmotogaceae bacterium]|nr:hypothetical protein [Kosmotogaceae bacterium]